MMCLQRWAWRRLSREKVISGAFEGLDMSVSNVEQHTFLEVNEKGAEAAAVTVVNGTTAPLFRAVVFNRPFVFQYVKTPQAVSIYG